MGHESAEVQGRPSKGLMAISNVNAEAARRIIKIWHKAKTEISATSAEYAEPEKSGGHLILI